MRPIRVLYIEDDSDPARVVTDSLDGDGITARSVGSGEAALDELTSGMPDLVLVDIGLPGIGGIELCRRLRAASNVPVIAVSGSADPALAVTALDEGADDFLAKPFDRAELIARIRAHVRRARGEVVLHVQRLQAGMLVIDFNRRAIEIDGRQVIVTSTEFAVLAALARHPGKALTREDLLQLVHGTDDVAFDRSIDVLVSRLRSKLEPDPRHPDLIKTVRRVGYMLCMPAA